MLISSPWKITYDPAGASPLVLVNFDDDLGGVIKFPWDQAVQESPRTRAAWQRYYGRGNAATGLTFQVFKQHADFLAALAFCPNHVIAINTRAAAGAKDMHIELSNGTKWKLSDCTFKSFAPEVSTEDCTLTVTPYTIVASGWSVV